MKQECCLCNSNDLEVLYSPLTRSKPGVGENDFSPTASDFGIFYPLVRCKDCDAVFALTQKEKPGYRHLYALSKDNVYLLQSESRNKTFKRILSDIKNLVPAHSRVLDIGCSYGFFLRLAKDEGMEAWGVEPSEDASRYCREGLGLSVLCSDMEEAKLPKDYFDLVTATEVIEHNHDPAGFISKVRQVLKTGGLLYLVTPDTKSLSARIMKSRWWSYRRMHLFYLSKKSIHAFLKKNGFSIIKSSPYKKTFTLGYIISQFIKSGGNKLLYYPFLGLYKLLNIERIMITASFGDIAVLARKV